MQVFRCRICGDPYVGASKPSNCPFCGALDTHIILAKDWEEQEPFALTDVSRANLEHALMIEESNSLFYRCSYEVSMDAELSAMFRALAKVEAEHASTIRKLLSLAKPDGEEDTRGRCHALDMGNVDEAHDRETRAINFYTRAAEVATEPRVKEVFSALVEIEKTHIELVDKVAKKFQGTTNPVV